MSDLLLANEPLVRLAAFSTVFAAMVLWELCLPRRRLGVGRGRRWPSNIGIVALDTAIVRLLFPAAAVGVALACEARGWGLLHWLGTPSIIAVPAAVLALDLAIYGQHALFHHVPLLWRLHRMHHADLDIDVTTGVRFHPLEIILSILIKFAIVAALGAPPAAVLIFEVLLNATSMFNHSNARMPAAVDRIVRWLVVTPDMHRVHHSIIRAETDSNFGFNFPWWDRMFGTYRPEPREGHLGMTIGIEAFRDPAELRLDRMLTQPFRDDPAARLASRQSPAPQPAPTLPDRG
jgi:sterol desaturase/sphingolipid hydroxylase (fatty acid hydroxylase superfamily)